MNWTTNGRVLDRQRIPHATATRNPFNTLNQYGVQTRFQSEDLSVTAHAMSTNGSFHEHTVLHNPVHHPSTASTNHSSRPGVRLASSDSKAIGILRQDALQQQRQEQPAETRSLRRVKTMEGSILNKPLPAVKIRKEVTVDVLPPITSIIGRPNEVEELETSTFEDEANTVVDVSISNASTSSDDEDLISDDDDDENDEEVPQSSLKFHDPSQSSFSSLAEVDLPKFSNEFQPFVTTLVQERLLADHECMMTGILSSGMSSHVNNIVRAYQIMGPLDKNLLENALTNTVKIHPILATTFHRHNNKLYAHIPKEMSLVHLETPLSYEKPPELITLARRKAFEISTINHQSSSLLNTMRQQHSPGTYIDFDDHISVVSCGNDDSPKAVSKSLNNHPEPTAILPLKASNLTKLPSLDNTLFPPLIKAKLVAINPNEHVLILSFSSVVCDFWSSCLFIQQLSHAYAQLERMPAYRPSLAAIRTINKRQELVNNFESIRAKAGYKKNHNKTAVLGGRRLHGGGGPPSLQNGFNPICPPRAQFQQIATRENQLLLIRSREKLWTYWQSVVTVTIRRARGPPRIKVIPPIRVPNGFGELTRTTGLARPPTARIRPLTAARNRPQTARKGSGFGQDTMSLESLTGPKKELLFIKVSEDIGIDFIQSLSIEHSSKISRKEFLSLMCLGTYALMLGVCLKGWGTNDIASMRHTNGKEDTPTVAATNDPLLKYNNQQDGLSSHQLLSDAGRLPRGRTARRRSESRKRMDVGSFLIGIELSVRQLAPELTQGLFGPLSNLVGLRIDLSANPTFADLILSLWSSLQSARCHSHFPFSAVADELGLVQGLPVRFSYFYPHDIQQLSNPEGFHFMETTIGVTGKALAKFGSSCYMNPLCTKMEDTVQLELMLWESVRGNSVDGIFLYQTQTLRSEIVKNFSKEMLNLLSMVSQNPAIPLKELAKTVTPLCLHTRQRC